MIWPYALTIFLALVGILADTLIKISTQSNNKLAAWLFLLAGAIIYGFTALGWFYALKHLKLSTLGVWYAITTVLVLTLVSMVYFKEQLNLREVIGVGAAVVSLVLLARFA